MKNSGIVISEKGKVEVNENLQTNLSNVYALGDTIGKSGSAYGAERGGLIIACHILGMNVDDVNLDYSMFPDVVFTDPKLQRVDIRNKS